MKLLFNLTFRNVRFRKIIAVVAIVLTFRLIFPDPGLVAQTFKKFEKEKIDPYADRARKLNDASTFQNYLELGIATARVDWEEEANDLVVKEYSSIDKSSDTAEQKAAQKSLADARYDAALLQWEADAQDALETELGAFKATKESIAVTEVTQAQYEKMISDAEASVLANPAFDLSSWDAAIASAHDAIKNQFETEVSSGVTNAKNANAALTGKEKDAFEAELAKKEQALRTEFEFRDSFFIKRARNQYIALKRQDDFSAKLAADAESANNLGNAIIQDTLSDIEKQTQDALENASQGIAQVSEGATQDQISAAGSDWQKRMEAMIQSGLTKWEKAEEDLYKERLVWLEETKKSRAEGEAIWKKSHDELLAKRNEWLKTVQKQVSDGRAQWETKIAEFRLSREAAERELTDYVQQEKERWDASSSQLSEIVQGGGGALLEAKQSYQYYNELLTKAAVSPSDPSYTQLVAFYTEQRDLMGKAIQNFQSILSSSEGVLRDRMHSGSNDSGLLTDKRLYADTLPAQIKALSESNFKSDLNDLMKSNESFVLYERDMGNLSNQNTSFVNNALDLKANPDFDYNSKGTLAELQTLIDSMDKKYDSQKLELKDIFNKDRGTISDSDKLALIKTDIAAWFSDSTDENKRLKKKAVEYFNGGLNGYYLTGNDNDPYMMTRAEYEWELLRRERNYLTSRLRQAEAVKEYADIAYQHDAGLEISLVTNERADVAKIHADISEIGYKILKGDIQIDPVIRADDTLVAAKITELLSQKGISTAAIQNRITDLGTQVSMLDAIKGAAVPDRNQAESFRAQITAYLSAIGAGSSEHPLKQIEQKLSSFVQLIDSGTAAPETIANRWAVISGGAGDLSQVLSLLRNEYDLSGINSEIVKLADFAKRRTPQEIQADLSVTKEAMRLNANELALAREELDRAKDQYKQARIDLDILRGANAEDLIRIDLMNSTQALAGSLNRMDKYESVLGTELTDTITAKRLEYLKSVGDRETAEADLSKSTAMIGSIQGLEESKKRNAALGEILTSTSNLSGMSAAQVADTILAKPNLVSSSASDEILNSYPMAQQAFEQIKSLKLALTDVETKITAAIAAGKLADEIETLKAQKSRIEEAIFSQSETLIASIRGEETARRDTVYRILDVKKSGLPAVNTDALSSQISSAGKAYQDSIFDLATDVASSLESYINSKKKSSYADILTDLNTKIAASSRAVDTNANGYAGSTNAIANASPTGAAKDRTIWLLIRDYVMSNRAAIDSANKTPDLSDARSIDEKWNAISGSLSSVKADSAFFRNFQNSIPASKNDAWVIAFKNDRNALLSRLDSVISSGNPLTSFAALSASDRNILSMYGTVDSGKALASIKDIRTNVFLELSGADANFRDIYLRVKQQEFAIYASQTQPVLNSKRAELNKIEDEIEALKAEEISLNAKIAAELNPVTKTALQNRLTDVQDRVGILDGRGTTLRAEIAPLDAAYRTAINSLKEVTQPGSTAPLVQLTAGAMTRDANTLQMAQYALQQIQAAKPEAKTTAPEGRETADRLKAIIGMFETDSYGNIVKDGNGKPIVTKEFQDAGITDPDATLANVLGGSQTGANLMQWADRLQAYARDPIRSQGMPSELRESISLIENSVRDVIAAKLFISKMNLTPEELASQADAMLGSARALAQKFPEFATLESDLARALENANQTQSDPVSALLTVFEKQENINRLFVFEGYDASLKSDGVSDAEGKKRSDELRNLADQLRETRLQGTIAAVSAQYAQMMANYAQQHAANPYVLSPDRNQFLQSVGLPNFDSAASAIGAMNDATLRASLWTYVKSLPASEQIVAGVLYSVLSRDATDGASLKSAVLSALTATQLTVRDTLDVTTAESERITMRDSDLVIEKSVTDLMTKYSQRGTTSRSVMNGFISSLSDVLTISNAATQIDTKLNSDLSDPAYASIRSEIYKRINNAQSGFQNTAWLKNEITTYLNSIVDPPAGEVARLTDELHQTEILDAIARSDASSSYVAANYPEEIRDFVLIRMFNQAKERYAEFSKAMASDVESEKTAPLDLTGINGSMVKWILFQDFNSYAAGNPAPAFVAGGDRRSIGEYLSGYLAARNTDSSSIPIGLNDIAEKTASDEYLRIKAAGNLVLVDERTYFNDFEPYLLLAKIDDFVARNSITLTGATLADKKANFKTQFESFLDDATYKTADGKTLRQRYLTQGQLDDIFALSFAHLEFSTNAVDYLPSFLAGRISAGTLNTAYNSNPDQFLPPELTAIANYQTLNYKTMAGGISPQTLATLAREEISGKLSSENLSRILSSSEIDEVILRAGYGTVPAAVKTDLVSFIQSQNLYVTAGAKSTAEEAIAAIRQNKILSLSFATQADQEEVGAFFSANGTVITSVETKFFTELEKQSVDLRNAAKLNRGEFLASVIAKSTGTNDAYFNTLSPALQTELTSYASSFIGTTVSADEKTALQSNAAMFGKVFGMRSAQELAASGIFESAEAAVMGKLQAAGLSAADLANAKAHKNEIVTAFVLGVLTDAGKPCGLPGTSLNAQTDAAIARAVSTVDPNLKSVLVGEQVLVERFLTSFLESDAERNSIAALFKGPTLLSPDSKLSIAFESQKTHAILADMAQDTLSAVSTALGEHSQYLATAQLNTARDQDMANRLLKFSSQRAATFVGTRYSNYRTYLGAEKSYQDSAYAKYEADYQYQVSQGQTPVHLTSDQMQGGMVLEGQSLNLGGSIKAILAGDYEKQLKSDANTTSHNVQLGTDTASLTNDATVGVHAVQTVSNIAERQARGLSGEALYEQTFYENLGNNYLEAISRLNESLNTVFHAATMADERAVAAAGNVELDMLSKYDADATGAVDLTDALGVKQDAAGRASNNGDMQLAQKGDAAKQIAAGTEQAEYGYAEAGRRQQVLTEGLTTYLAAAAEPAKIRMDAATQKMNALADTEDALRADFGAQNREYVDSLDATANEFKDFMRLNDEYELRDGVRQYAQTPYLYASSTGNNESDQNLLKDHQADAKENLELAQQAVADAQSRMDEAAFAIQTQDRLEEFNAIAVKLQAGETFAALTTDESARLDELRAKTFDRHEDLDAAEAAELATLTEREMAVRYAQLFQTRSEHIIQTMRMVRIHKAAEIINAEIEQRRAVAEAKKQNFERVLANEFPVSGDPGKAARDKVYMRLAGIVEAAGPFANMAMYNEYKSYFWGGSGWVQAYGGSYVSASIQSLFPANTPAVTISPQLEAAAGMIGAAAMDSRDREAIGAYFGAGGSIADYSGFSGVYFAFLQSLSVYDIANIKNMITQAIFIPLQYVGLGMVIAGRSLQMMGAALGPFGIPLMYQGMALSTAGAATVQLSVQRLVVAQAELGFATMGAMIMQVMSVASATTNQTTRTMQAQQEYEKAQASLDYFTKVPDMQQLKERLMQFGAQHGDDESGNAKYKLTEEDLKYLLDDQGSMNSSGTAVTLSAQDQSDAIDVTSAKNQTELIDSFGRRYHMNKPPITSPPGPLSGGAYRGSDGDYTRVRMVDHAGNPFFAYAKIIPDTDPKDVTYDAGGIINALVDHGDKLRDDRKNKYIAAGNAADTSGDDTFVLRDRDNVYDQLFASSTNRVDGGREFSGYRITYVDVVENADDVYSAELNQRLNVQRKDWDLREQALVDAQSQWESRVAAIVNRGQESWANAENKFLAEQRKWEKKVDEEEAAGKKHWEDATKEHFAKKQAWETEMAAVKAKADVTTNLSSIIDALNAQISGFNQSMHLSMDQINKSKMISDAIESITKSLPVGAEKLKQINDSIAQFNTKLAITELSMTGNSALDLKLTDLSVSFDQEMEQHEKDMAVLANVKIYQAYQDQKNQIKEQIQDQNRAVDQQTTAAAMGAGFIRMGSKFVKTSAAGGMGAVDAYNFMDADRAINDAFGASGYQELSGAALVNFLKNSNDAEVDAFFTVQKLRLTRASEMIFGTGTQETRSTSRDVKDLGTLAMWIGAGPDSNQGSLMTRGAGSAGAAANLNLIGGFGELGEYGARPSGVPFGFYVQLAWMGDQISEHDSAVVTSIGKHAMDGNHSVAIASAAAGGLTAAMNAAPAISSAFNTALHNGGTGGLESALRNAGQQIGMQAGIGYAGGELANLLAKSPIGTMMNQFNPAIMLANTSYNMQYGSKVLGIDSGYLMEANLISSLKAPVNALGSALIAVPPIGTAIGIALVAAANSVQANPTTGERSMKMTDQAAIATAVAVVSALATAGAGSAAASAAQAGIQATSSVATGAIIGGVSALASSGMRYTADGVSQGWSLTSHGGDMHGEQVLLATAIGAIGGAAGGAMPGAANGSGFAGGFASAMAKDAVSTAINVSAQYAAQQAWGANHSSYAQLQAGPDLSRLGELLGAGVIGGVNQMQSDEIQAMLKSGKSVDQIKAAMSNNLLPTFVSVENAGKMYEGQQRNERDQKQRAAEALMAAAVEEERRKALMGAAKSTEPILERDQAAALIRAQIGALNAKIFAETGKNLLIADGAAGKKMLEDIKQDLSNLKSSGKFSEADMAYIAQQYGASPGMVSTAETANNFNFLQRDYQQRMQAAQQANAPSQLVDPGKAWVSPITREPGFLGSLSYAYQKAGEAMGRQADRLLQYGAEVLEKNPDLKQIQEEWDAELNAFRYIKEAEARNRENRPDTYNVVEKLTQPLMFGALDSLYGTIDMAYHPAQATAGFMNLFGAGATGTGKLFGGEYSVDQILDGASGLAFKGIDAADDYAMDAKAWWQGDASAGAKTLARVAAAGVLFLEVVGPGGKAKVATEITKANKLREVYTMMAKTGMKGPEIRAAIREFNAGVRAAEDARLMQALKESREGVQKYLQTEEHIANKAAAFKRYSGSMSPAKWAQRYDTITANMRYGTAAEEAFAAVRGGSKATIFVDPAGEIVRFVDNRIGNVAREIKSGYLKDGDFVRKQIQKDAEIVARGRAKIDKAEWHLFQGGSDSAINRLKKAGMKVYDYSSGSRVVR